MTRAFPGSDEQFEEWNREGSPGCALGVYRAGETIYHRGYGTAHLEHGVPITSDSVFHIASVSKQFTAMLVCLLARSGRLSLDDPLVDYLPELAGSPVVTFRQSLHHTSGLRDQWDLLRLAGWRRADLKTTADILHLASSQKAQNFAPGERYQYVNTGYTLITIAIERILGISFRQAAHELLFEPLGMHRTFFQDDHREVIPGRAQAYSSNDADRFEIDVPDYETCGPTGLFSTVEDFAAWERNFLHPRVGDEELVRQLTAPGSLSDGRETRYGLGLVLGHYRGCEVVEHAGGDAGYRAHFLRLPREQLAVAIFCNLSTIQPGKLARRVADICLGDRLEAPSEETGSAWAGRAAGVHRPTAAELEERIGVYRDVLSQSTCRIESRGMRLFLVAPGTKEFELAPVDAKRYRFETVEAAEVVFEAASGDRPARMTVTHEGQETGRCERIGGLDDEGPAADPAELVGGYHSDELGVAYRVEADREGWKLQRPKHHPDELKPLATDEMLATRSGLHLRFTRDPQNRIDGLIASAERAWNVRFERLADGA